MGTAGIANNDSPWQRWSYGQGESMANTIKYAGV